MDVVRVEEVRYRLRLKKGRDRSVRLRHPWIFSGAVAEVEALPSASPGDVGDVVDAEGTFLARGTVQPDSQILCRIFTWKDESLGTDLFRRRLLEAAELRRTLVASERTSAYRLVNSEGDGLPGLVVDRYGPVLAVQTLTSGMQRLRSLWLDLLVELFHPQAIVERGERARREPVPATESPSPVIRGVLPDVPLAIRENSLHFQVDLLGGQKTGFYLDQRDNRALLGSFSKGKEVLNLFGYTGAFSIYAGAGGAERVVQVETSSKARELAAAGWELNQLDPHRFELVPDDAFEYLRGTDESFDLLVLDPPPLARSRGSVEHALRAYKDLNLWAFCRARPGSMVATFSCSQHVSGELFQKVLFGAARDVGASVQWMTRLGPGLDHPVHLDHPQGEYLKGMLLRVLEPGRPPGRRPHRGERRADGRPASEVGRPGEVRSGSVPDPTAGDDDLAEDPR